MLSKYWNLLKDSVSGYMADGAMSRGAAIAYYTVFSLAPLLVIAIGIAGLVFGEEAARGAIVGQLQGMMGRQAAETIQSMLAGASSKSSGIIATVAGLVTLLITASGVFGEMQASLNLIWKAAPPRDESTVTHFVKAKAASIGLVASLGFLLIVSLVASAGLSALGRMLHDVMPGLDFLLSLLNFVVSFAILSALFAAIYKVLPDRKLEWRDVLVGAAATSLLFTIGKSLIGLYLGSSSAATSYGAASAVVILLLWVYYSSQIFLLGAEFTRAYAETHGSHKDAPPVADQAPAPAAARPALVGQRNPVLTALAAATVLVTAVREARR